MARSGRTYVLDNPTTRRPSRPWPASSSTPAGKLPVTDPKRRPENRGLEYDSVTNGSRYPEFLVTEMLPQVEKRVRLAPHLDPEGRGLAGSSSGGICAFTACWSGPTSSARFSSGCRELR